MLAVAELVESLERTCLFFFFALCVIDFRMTRLARSTIYGSTSIHFIEQNSQSSRFARRMRYIVSSGMRRMSSVDSPSFAIHSGWNETPASFVDISVEDKPRVTRLSYFWHHVFDERSTANVDELMVEATERRPLLLFASGLRLEFHLGRVRL